MSDTTALNLDRNGLEILSREESLRLLSSVSVGRVSVTIRALPRVLPVNYLVDGETIVFRTGNGTKLHAALKNTVVAFEADDLDPETRTGWSVMVIGTAEQVTDDAERARLETLDFDNWVSTGNLDHFVKVPVVHIGGRRLLSPPS